jgi:hypothetical protein
MLPFPVMAFLTGMLVSAVYSAAIVIFWGLMYMIGCILIVVKSPKICKGIFAGSCGLGAMVGGALTSVTAAAMGMGKLGVATGAFGSGKVGQAASAAFDVPLPGGAATKKSASKSDSSGTGSSSGDASPSGSQPPSASMEAILATGAPVSHHQATGSVSRGLAKRRFKSQIPKVQTPKKELQAPNTKEIR